jgi:L-ribulose-5-phosphate 3-epimerase UlaE
VTGEVDWRAHLSELKRRDYQGPFLFEMAPGPDCWQRLEAAKLYLQQQLA